MNYVHNLPAATETAIRRNAEIIADAVARMPQPDVATMTALRQNAELIADAATPKPELTATFERFEAHFRGKARA
jgi:hypothetical protein